VSAPRRFFELPRIVHRELVLLLVLSAVAGGAYVFTQAAATATDARTLADAAAWYERGQTRLAEGRSAEAITALRRAVARDPERWDYARRLAEALAADGQTAPARQALLQWRLRRPDDVDVNLQLARLEARVGDATAGIGYYESALYGHWDVGAQAARQALRREVIAYLLSRDETSAALAHVQALAANQPDRPAAHRESAALFLAAGDATRALEYYQRALRLAPDDAEARAGAGGAAFALGDYARVLTLLRGATDEASVDRYRVAAAVIANDPLQPRLSFAERERRLRRALAYALARLDSCGGDAGHEAAATPAAPTGEPASVAPPPGALDSLAATIRAWRDALTPAALRESADALEQGLTLVHRALTTEAPGCPPLDARGEALVRAARRHGATD
jgi:tetratricopeptide (TPR) repeat protein